MKKTLFILLSLTIYKTVCAQSKPDITLTINDIIAEVQKAQQALQTIEYTLQRTDTLVTGNTRIMTGKVLLQVIPQDTVYGFHFFAKQDGDNSEQVYDGHIAYHTDQDKKRYEMSITGAGFSRLAGTGGGRLLMRDLVKIDTSRASKITLAQDEKYYYLAIHHPDLTEYDVVRRRKTITIDKTSMLPVAVREHQETFGKTQDLYYHVTGLKINKPLNYNFSSPPFLNEYTQFIPAKTTHPALSLVNTQSPALALSSFDGEQVTSDNFEGKVVLLDLWEVWCGPCIINMPKMENLYQKYKSKDFQVYGVVNDLKQLEAAKKLIKTKGITFPVLSGSPQFKKDFKFDGGVPLYILIDKGGVIRWINWGDAADMEEVIVRALQ